MVVRWIREEIGAQQVSTVVSDNAFGMDFARDLAVKEPRFSHMLPLRYTSRAFCGHVADARVSLIQFTANCPRLVFL